MHSTNNQIKQPHVNFCKTFRAKKQHLSWVLRHPRCLLSSSWPQNPTRREASGGGGGRGGELIGTFRAPVGASSCLTALCDFGVTLHYYYTNNCLFYQWHDKTTRDLPGTTRVLICQRQSYAPAVSPDLSFLSL